jgi:hypothetical protein
MRGGGSAPTDLRTFARTRTIPEEVTDVSIYTKGPGHPEGYPGPVGRCG